MYDPMDDDDGYGGRNARRRPGRPSIVGPRPYVVQTAPAPAYGQSPYGYSQPPYGYSQPPYGYGQGPWSPPPPPVVDRFTGSLKTGMMIDIAAQMLAAIASLPAPPTATREVTSDLANMITYQAALAQHAKRDEQIRTAGALARLLMG